MNNQTKNYLHSTTVERERDTAVILLQRVLTDSDISTELDREIATFLEKIDELPDEWLNYFEDEL